uniref:Uncharacterized protein n=1 Tax=uncultured bacterium contig00085 TaxID=1181558 RepID=A0A806KHY6_9BACT|nr:hypothetical protein [uncultured bacterium contig00085]
MATSFGRCRCSHFFVKIYKNFQKNNFFVKKSKNFLPFRFFYVYLNVCSKSGKHI